MKWGLKISPTPQWDWLGIKWDHVYGSGVYLEKFCCVPGEKREGKRAHGQVAPHPAPGEALDRACAVTFFPDEKTEAQLG